MLRGSIDEGESCCKGRRGDADSYFGPSAGGKGIATLGSVMGEVYACPCPDAWIKAGSVAARNTSRTRPCCCHVGQENHKPQAKFECVECGHKNDADVVDAIDILERGHRLFA